jgi:hypothetical protein
MTTDRDRVEAGAEEMWRAEALRARGRDRSVAWSDVADDEHARWRGTVAEAIDPDKGHAGAAFAAADRVLALLPAAPPPGPEDVRGERMTGLASRFWRVGRRVPKNIYVGDEVAAQFQREEWAEMAVSAVNSALLAGEHWTRERKRLVAERDTLTRRVRELEEALSAERGGAETLDNEGQPDQPAPEETLDEEVARLQKEHLAGALADATRKYIAKLQQQRDMWRDCFEEITAKTTPYGSGPPDDPERVTRYIIPAGPLHRAAGKTGVQAFGMQDRIRELEEALRGALNAMQASLAALAVATSDSVPRLQERTKLVDAAIARARAIIGGSHD